MIKVKDSNIKKTCVMILSDKRSGSSILQYELAKHPYVNIISKTRHFKNETLYWNKAVALLDLPQPNMKYSREIPMGKKTARKEIIKLLSDNLDSFNFPKDPKKMIFEGWYALCEEFRPVFLEKSPHHLHSWSALKLIAEFKEKFHKDIKLRFIGLIRNPMDLLYSILIREGMPPQERQYEWFRAYKNLMRFKRIVRQDLFMIRYEDLVGDIEYMQNICDFIGIPWIKGIGARFRKNSIRRWEKDETYTFQIAKEIMEFAGQFYKKTELSNKNSAK